MSTNIRSQTILSQYYEECLAKNGATPQGVDWPNLIDLKTRLKIMLGIVDGKNNYSILDLGCGYGSLVDYIKAKQLNFQYTGLDISEKMIKVAQKRHPEYTFICQDILLNPIKKIKYDYVILNGVFTEKRILTWNEMSLFMQDMLKESFKICKKGIAFNVMSQHVDWCNPNLFYCSFDQMANYLIQHCSRNFKFRADYGLYEYTAYVYHEPQNR